MKPHTLPVKRRPAPKGMFKRLSAVTNRKQRVAATAHPEAEIEDGSSRISRALTIIFLIHIVAIGLIFVHQKFLDGRPGDEATLVKVDKPLAVAAPAQLNLPKIAAGEKTYYIERGDNYAKIAAKLGVDENDLREINNHTEITTGLKLKIPVNRIVAQTPPEVAEIGQNKPATAPDDGLVEAHDVRGAPKAIVAQPNLDRETPPTQAKTTKPAAAKPPATAPKSASSGKSYTVKSGDSIWRIANRHKVSEGALMKANGISDARKIKPGMSLTIP